MKMNLQQLKILLLLFMFLNGLTAIAGDVKTLAIGSKAPDFNLPGVDGKNYSLADFKDATILTIIFTCNHCPTAQAYEDRIIQLVKDYKDKGVAFIAISPNSPAALCLEEEAYTNLDDTYESMKLRAKNKNFNFPYLYDGDTQETSLKYGPVATPHVFIFDKNRILQYTGRIDNMENPYKSPTEQDTRNALDAMLNNQPVKVQQTKTFGCSIKWAEKSAWREKLDKDWAAKPVDLNDIDAEGVRKLIANQGDKLRLINVWATWCGPCVIEFPEFVKFERMYKERNFEFVSVSADSPGKKDKVISFLKEKQAATTNYLYNSDDKYQLIEAVDPDWGGALPYTLLLAPGGKVLYKNQGAVDPLEVRTAIINYLGRFYADNK